MLNRTLPFLCLSALACTDLTAPSTNVGIGAEATPRPVAPAAAQAPAPPPAKNPAADLPKPRRSAERVTASQILVSYQGAKRAEPRVKRTKEQAKQRAEELLARARKEQDFSALAFAESDDPTAKEHRGNLGTFDRYSMPPAFSEAAFGLEPGQISQVVETDYGFHIIKRTQ